MSKLTKLDENATKVFLQLIDGLQEPGAYKVFDKHNYLPERNGGIMSVHIECIGTSQYSVAHYYEQNGDLMSDPHMSFWVCDGNVYPASFTQHGLFQRFEVSIRFDENCVPNGFKVKIQREHADFANFWMKNIADQQEL